MSVTLKAPQDKKIRGQLSWIKHQLGNCRKKNEKTFQKIQNEIIVDISLKNTSKSERVNIENLDIIYGEIKEREIREFKVILIKDLGKKFSNCRKFVEIIENMIIDYYSCVVQYLTKWEEPAPKIIEKDDGEIKKQETVDNYR